MLVHARTRHAAVLAGALGIVLLFPSPAEGSEPEPRIGRAWVAQLESWHGIPSSLAMRFGRAAVAGGLTPMDTARLLNDDRFVAAVGAPDQGWGLLEALIERPSTIVDAHMLLQGGSEYTRTGATSFQYAFLLRHPELRNAYLADLGDMIAVRRTARKCWWTSRPAGESSLGISSACRSGNRAAGPYPYRRSRPRRQRLRCGNR